jgi:TPR repeat protein
MARAGYFRAQSFLYDLYEEFQNDDDDDEQRDPTMYRDLLLCCNVMDDKNADNLFGYPLLNHIACTGYRQAARFMTKLACHYRDGSHGVLVASRRQYLFWIKRAAERGDPEGRYLLGREYARMGDWDKATEWLLPLTRSLDKNENKLSDLYDLACLSLGDMCMNRASHPDNSADREMMFHKEAKIWYERTFDTTAAGMFAIGKMVTERKLPESEDWIAADWFERGLHHPNVSLISKSHLVIFQRWLSSYYMQRSRELELSIVSFSTA